MFSIEKIRLKFIILFLITILAMVYGLGQINEQRKQVDLDYESLKNTAVQTENSDSPEITTRKSDIYNQEGKKIGAALENINNQLLIYTITIKEEDLPEGFSYVGWLEDSQNKYYLLGKFQKKFENYQLDQVFNESANVEKISISVEKDEDLEKVTEPSNIILTGYLEPIMDE